MPYVKWNGSEMVSISVSRRRLAVGLSAAFAFAGLSTFAAPAANAVTGPVTVSLTFNDGLASQYKYARPVLQAHGVNATFYVASSWVATNDATYMRSWQLDDLYRDGDEIGAMGKDHRDLTATYSSDPSADLAYKQDQVCGDRAKLTALGYATMSFAYPFSAQNATAQSIISGCGFTSGRLVGGLSSTGPTYAEALPPANAYTLRTLGATTSGPVTLASMQNSVTAAYAKGGGWVPLSFNAVCDASDPGYSACMAGSTKPVDDAVLSQFLDWMANGAPAGSSVHTVRSVMGAPPQPPLPPRPTAVSVTFDDGEAAQYGAGALLTSHGQTGTFYINSGAVDAHEQGAMTWDQITSLAAAGNDIGGHTSTHANLTTTSTTYDSKWHQVCDDRARLFAMGFNPVSFAYPEGAFNSASAGIVKGCGYSSARTAGSLSASGPRYAELFTPTDPYTFQAVGTTYNGPITLQVLQDAVNAAVAHGGGWVPLVFHALCYPGTDAYTACMAGYRPVDSTVFDAFLGWLASSASRGVAVRTVADVIANSAGTPVISVQSPAQAASGVSATPVLSGTAPATGDQITVQIYSGRYTTVAPTMTLTMSVAPDGTWSVSPPSPLTNGIWTVQASQTRASLTGRSTPTTFTVTSTP